MIHDRDYMREPAGGTVRASTVLLWVLGGCFIIQTALVVFGRVPVVETLGLSRAGMGEWEVWRLLTFQFLHQVPWPLHVISNALGIYFFGYAVEEAVGLRRYLALYLGGGVLGGLAQVGLDWALHRPASLSVIGASAGVSTVMALYCRLHPERELSFFLFVFPVRMRARTLLWLMAASTVFGIVFPFGSRVAHMAHLGGMALGVAAPWFLDRGWLDGFEWPGWRSLLRRRRATSGVVIPFPGGKRSPERPAKPPAGAGEDGDFVSREIDPILEKIAASGLESLTSEERRKLDEARRRMTGDRRKS